MILIFKSHNHACFTLLDHRGKRQTARDRDRARPRATGMVTARTPVDA